MAYVEGGTVWVPPSWFHPASPRHPALTPPYCQEAIPEKPPMEKLIIQNFLTIHSAEIDVRRFNVFIGPQASGKSIVAKLLYFFKAEFGKVFEETARKMQGKREFHATLKSKFETIFPRIYWDTQAFSIAYHCGELTILVKSEAGLRNKTKWSITCSDGVYGLQAALKKKYETALEGKFSEHAISQSLTAVWMDHRNGIANSNYSRILDAQVFIPANRSFFAALQKNIFSILAHDIQIDYFLKDFGSTYENAKRWFTNDVFWEMLAEEPKQKRLSIMGSIVAGQYSDENGEDWIVSPTGKINLAHASSGQQESLPMLLVLCAMPYVCALQGRAGFFIEEPEAHLFPVSQQAVVSLLALIANTTPHQLFITTHSPYILTALNNCILADATYESADEAGKQKVLEIMPKHQHVALKDVAAWTVTEKGTIESILDEEAGIIGASILDGVSQHFEGVMNELLDIRYGGPSL